MSVGITYDTFNEASYLTAEEYKNAPTALDITNLVVGGNQDAQDAELRNVIRRASSYMNEYFNQNLVAAENVETQRIRVTPDGFLALHPFNSPVIALTNLQYGTMPTNLTTLPDCSQVWFENQQVIVPLYQNVYSSQGPLAFGFPPSTSSRIYVKYTYIAGFVNTLCTGTAGDSNLTVADGTGVMAGQNLTIYDSAKSETVTVADTYVFGSTTVPLTSPLTKTHTGVAFGNLPGAIKEACILITSAFIKRRGDQALTMMTTTRPSGMQQGAQLYGDDIRLALDMVDKYRRVR